MLPKEDEVRSADEPLEVEAADPGGAPRPVAPSDPMLKLIAALGVGTVALGGLLVPAFLTTGQTCGATRSAKIEWERRQLQIEQVIREDQDVPAHRSLDSQREDPARDSDTR